MTPPENRVPEHPGAVRYLSRPPQRSHDSTDSETRGWTCPGCFAITFLGFCLAKAVKERSPLARNLFISGRLSVVTINLRHSIENEIPRTRYLNSCGCVTPNLLATNHGQRTTSNDFRFRASLSTFRRNILAKASLTLSEGVV